MAPVEVLLLLATLHSAEIIIIAVLLQPDPRKDLRQRRPPCYCSGARAQPVRLAWRLGESGSPRASSHSRGWTESCRHTKRPSDPPHAYRKSVHAEIYQTSYNRACMSNYDKANDIKAEDT
jgi:hypothetical protein